MQQLLLGVQVLYRHLLDYYRACLTPNDLGGFMCVLISWHLSSVQVSYAHTTESTTGRELDSTSLRQHTDFTSAPSNRRRCGYAPPIKTQPRRSQVRRHPQKASRHFHVPVL